MGCEVCGEGLVGVGVVDGMADCRDSPMSHAGEPIGSKSMEDLDNCPFRLSPLAMHLSYTMKAILLTELN